MKTVVTCALPYANGDLHLGHMVEQVQADIYVRYRRSAGHDVVFLCADDTHGAPIEVNALKQGKSPEAFVAEWAVAHQRDSADFGISFDHYGSTHSAENQHFASLIYERAKAAGTIVRKEIEQPFDPKAGRWLSDRFIRGTCPNCGAADQYGDACEVCNATYTPRELKDARSALSGEPLTWKKSEHVFFSLSRHADFLAAQLEKPSFMNPGSAEQLKTFFAKGLADWDITRDGPYFGFPIPGEVNKFFYVWLDAPIGYIASTEQWAKRTGVKGGAMAFWAQEADAEVVHVIGKDIVYFHCLFWPAVLHVAGLKVPKKVHIHGHLTVNGQKMSKTRGTFVNARPYLELLDPNYLRFFYASLLGPGTDDIDLSLAEFRQRVNAELVNNLGNLANRTLSLLASLGGPLSAPQPAVGQALVQSALARVPEIAQAFASFDHRAAVKAILEIGYAANQFLAKAEPWKVLKTDPQAARAVLSEAAEVVYLLTALLEPIVPQLSAKLLAQLNRPRLTFAQLEKAAYPLLSRESSVGVPAPLIARLEEVQVAGLLKDAKLAEPVVAKVAAAKPKAPVAEPPAEIDFSDFAKVQLKVGKVIACEKVEKADKLLKLSVDVGEPTPRTIVSGIAEAYPRPAELVGRHVVVVANLKPRALKGIESKGMLLTSGPGGANLRLLDPGEAVPGSEVK